MQAAEYRAQIQAATDFIRNRVGGTFDAGLVLGTGLGVLLEDLELDAEISYEEIPFFPRSTAISHAGKLLAGTLGGKRVLIMSGRFHYYEGYTMKQLTLPIRVMKRLGCELLITSNAVGGLNPLFRRGDIMVLTDHINLIGDNPLIGENLDEFGDRFPDMLGAYSPKIVDLTMKVALEAGIYLQKGVLVAVAGPNLETPAEYRFLRTIGADAVGMSTIPEVLVAVHQKMKVLSFSVITDMGLPDAMEPADVNEIIRVANETAPKLRTVILGVLEGM